MAKQVADASGSIPVELFTGYLDQYVMLLKTMGKLVEIGFSDVSSKAEILRNNKKLMDDAGTPVNTIEELMEKEKFLGLGNVNGKNNSKKGFDKKSKYYKHIGSWRTMERMLRFLKFLKWILENLYNNREDSLRACIQDGYSKELGPYHNFFLRGIVKGILYLAPDRETFVNGITENIGHIDEEERYVKVLIIRL